MGHPMFDFEVMVENEKANEPEKVKVLSRHDEDISPFQPWIDWEGTEGLFVQANAKGTLYHFIDRHIPLTIRMNVTRYTILSGERYKKRIPRGPYSY